MLRPKYVKITFISSRNSAKEYHLHENHGVVGQHPVFVNVYDASRLPRLPPRFHRLAIEVLGDEYMFTDAKDGSSAVLSGVPNKWGLPLLRSILVGRSTNLQSHVHYEVHYLSRDGGEFTGKYHPKTNNSRSFVLRLCSIILLPEYRQPAAALIPTSTSLSFSIESKAKFLTAKAQGTAQGMPRRQAEVETLPVVLNVYEVDPGGYCSRPDVKFFCSSVEVGMSEFMFSDYRGQGGIQIATLGFIPIKEGLRQTEAVVMGRTRAREREEFEALVQELTTEHKYGMAMVMPSDTEDWFSKNCNDFAQRFCFALTGNSIPRWLRTGEAPMEEKAAAWWRAPLSCLGASRG